MKRLIPTFSTRRLLLIVLLVAAYFGAWQATRRAAAIAERDFKAKIAPQLPPDVFHSFLTITSPCPFVIRRDLHLSPNKLTPVGTPSIQTTYSVWVFGYRRQFVPGFR